jgi:hypothetical protein
VEANSQYSFHGTEDFKNGLTGWRLGSFTQLFFDNLSTLLGPCLPFSVGMTNFGVSRSVIVKSSFGRIVPVLVLLCLGNIYSWQAIRLTNRHGRQYTAQSVLNTTAFAFVL